MKRIGSVFLLICSLLVMIVPVCASTTFVPYQWYEGRNLSYQIGSSYDSYTEYPGYYSTGLIPVSSGDTVTLTFGASNVTYYRLLIYDSDRVLLDVPYYGGSGSFVFHVLDGVSFFALRGVPGSFLDAYLALTVSLIAPEPEPEPEPVPGSSADLLGSVSLVVHSSVSWIASFCSSILSASVLLVPVLLALVGFGVGLVRRLRR